MTSLKKRVGCWLKSNWLAASSGQNYALTLYIIYRTKKGKLIGKKTSIHCFAVQNVKKKVQSHAYECIFVASDKWATLSYQTFSQSFVKVLQSKSLQMRKDKTPVHTHAVLLFSLSKLSTGLFLCVGFTEKITGCHESFPFMALGVITLWCNPFSKVSAVLFLILFLSRVERCK